MFLYKGNAAQFSAALLFVLKSYKTKSTVFIKRWILVFEIMLSDDFFDLCLGCNCVRLAAAVFHNVSDKCL